nr:hypothetical protein CFP56_61784 [Quercus suber]
MTLAFREDEVPLLDDSPSNLMSLKKLKIWGCLGLTSLSEAVGYLTSLSSLAFQDLPKLEVFWPSKRRKNIYILGKYGDGMHCLDTFRIWEANVAKNIEKPNAHYDYVATNKRCLHHVRISLLFILKYCKANQELESQKYEYTSMSLLTLRVGDEHYSLVAKNCDLLNQMAFRTSLIKWSLLS